MTARTGLAALSGVTLAVPTAILATSLDGDPVVFRSAAALLALVLLGWLGSGALRTPSPVRSLVWSAIRARRRYRVGPASATIVITTLLAYAGTGLGFLLVLWCRRSVECWARP